METPSQFFSALVPIILDQLLTRKAKVALHKTMKFFIKDFFSKCEQIHSFLKIWSHLVKKSLMESFISCAV